MASSTRSKLKRLFRGGTTSDLPKTNGTSLTAQNPQGQGVGKNLQAPQSPTTGTEVSEEQGHSLVPGQHEDIPVDGQIVIGESKQTQTSSLPATDSRPNTPEAPSSKRPERRSRVQSPRNDTNASSTPASSTRNSVNLSDIWYNDPAPGVNSKEDTALSISPTIGCEIKAYMGNEPLEDPEHFSLPWLEAGQYDYIDNKIRSQLKRYSDRVVSQVYTDHPSIPSQIARGLYSLPAGRRISRRPIIYRTSAEVKLYQLDPDGEKPEKLLGSETVNHRYHWNELVPKLVAKHGSENLFAKLRLDVIWRFNDVQSLNGDSLADDIWNAVNSKKLENWRGQTFLPKTDLDGIFTEEIIHALLSMDPSLPRPNRLSNAPNGVEQKRLTPVDIRANASLLLAICIQAQKPLSCLGQLVINCQIDDLHLPLQERPQSFLDINFQPLQGVQKMFLVYDFKKANLQQKMREGTLEVINNWYTVPLMGGGLLGEGGFGVVKEVTIHPAYHDFKENVFALKELKHTISATSRQFAKEHSVFSNLMAIDHANILVPLGMWRQQSLDSDDKFYMLYPKAECNLRQYLRRFRERPQLSRDFVAHLILQLRNLADALEAIHLLRKKSGLVEEDGKGRHNASGAADKTSQSSLHPSAAQKSPQKTVYHHDLKPANILIFKDGSWKISDFGTAGVTQAVYGKSIHELTGIQKGDYEYSPPDGSMGIRAYDVWSFGCILLEILLTVFEEGTGDQLDVLQPTNPETHRLDVFFNDRCENPRGVAAYGEFWYQSSDGKYHLRKAVQDRLEMLGRRTRGFDQFDELVKLTKNMLAIEASHRPSAPEVLARMRKVHMQVMHNLSTNENFYTVPNSIPQPYASWPTTDGASQVSSYAPGGQSSMEPSPDQSRQLPVLDTRRPRPRSISSPTSDDARLHITGGPTYNFDETYATVVDGTSTTPIVRIHQPADSISLTSSEGGTLPGRRSPTASADDNQ